MKTIEQLRQRSQKTNSHLCVGIDLGPHLNLKEIAPDHPDALSFIQYLVTETQDFAASYKFQLAGYLAMGIDGLSLLKDGIAFTKETVPSVPIILDAKVSDISVTLANYARFIFDELGVDAVTANPYLGGEANKPLLERDDKLIYFLASTSNPGSGEFQSYGERDLYLYVAERVNQWNIANNCGLVVGATHPDRIQAIREVAPDLPFLMPGLGAQGAQPEEFLPPALTEDPASVVVNVSRGIMLADHPKESAKVFAEQINTAASSTSSSMFNHKQSVIDLLVEAGCIQYGEFTLASGQTSPVYVDLRLLSGTPHTLSEIARHLERVTADVDYDLIVTIPTAGLALGTALALRTGKPLLYVRKKAKDYGRTKQIEGGVINEGNRVLLLDDVISTGGSKVDAIEVLREAGAIVDDVVVVVDRREILGEPFMEASVHAPITLGDLLA